MCSEKQIGTNRKKTEQIRTNRNKSGYSRKQGAQFGTNRKKTGKSEQIGTNRGGPLLPTQTGGSEDLPFLAFFEFLTLFFRIDLDGPIRTNRFADSRESPDSRESFQGSRTEPPVFCESRLGGAKNCESQV